jgi:hypothetical protein
VLDRASIGWPDRNQRVQKLVPHPLDYAAEVDRLDDDAEGWSTTP